MLLHEFMLAAGRSTPDRPAVVELSGSGGLVTTTYRRLEELADAYANSLREFGIGVGDKVILESDTSAAAISLLLACSKVGATFVPVSPETPEQRLRSITDATSPALHLQGPEGKREGLEPSIGTARFDAGGIVLERAPQPRVRRRREPVETDTAYMIFTSGTTGRPKGVVMSHRGVTAFYQGMIAEEIVTADDRVATTSPLQFDFSLLDIGLALGSGAAVVPVPRAVLYFPRRFLSLLEEAEVTHVDGVPSIWRPVLRHEPELLAGLTRLGGILFCGENFPLPELRRLQELLPKVRIVNCYGATESMAASFTDVPNPLPEDTEKLSIGHAHRGADMLVFDEEGRPVDEPGTVGEIHLYSPALFTGYWDDPEATARALVADPLDPQSGRIVLRTGDLAYAGEGGELYFVGRRDSQVQIRGNRVEIGEVERAILEFPQVSAAAVLALPLADGELALHAFVVPALEGPGLSEAALAAFCKKTLQHYMVPARLIPVEQLPVTSNGKTDRKALAARYARSGS
ncbi:AMP-binding protein [Streptomyces sp. NPDC051109]|uniref:AMP-binding protein n=1 Tax=Streptomyces sp. NPDC051109 TaxID=3365642 RepID=UPI0010665FB2